MFLRSILDWQFMCRISISNLRLIARRCASFFFWATLLVSSNGHTQGVPVQVPDIRAPHETHPTLTQPLHSIFSHPRHKQTFETLQVGCTDCHNFSVHSSKSDPLAPQVHGRYLQPVKQLCHQCHLGKVAMPVPNQCQLCHSDVASLKPVDHYSNWKERHGRFAQLNRDSCTQCHTPQSCANCHAKRDTAMPVVHPPNFRLMHSIEARMNPQKCTACHRSVQFCTSCHTGARK